jgi:hypothetical protein
MVLWGLDAHQAVDRLSCANGDGARGRSSKNGWKILRWALSLAAHPYIYMRTQA